MDYEVRNLFFLLLSMDPPKTRKESKKDQKEKGSGKDGKYSQKHIRLMETLREKVKK
jgi:hypothetical protein